MGAKRHDFVIISLWAVTLPFVLAVNGTFAVADEPASSLDYVPNTIADNSGVTRPGYVAGTTTRGGGGVNVGYYETIAGAGLANQAVPITAAGLTPVQLFDLTAVDLSSIQVLFVDNRSNSIYGAEYLSRLADIQNAVSSGMVLIFHDWYVTGAASVMPGGGAITFTRAPGAAIDVLDNTTTVTNGPAGIIDNTSLDLGTASNHGYASGSFPAGAVFPLSTATPTEIVTFSYRFGNGAVIYSTIPLLAYLGGNPPVAFGSIYAPNVLSYGAELIAPVVDSIVLVGISPTSESFVDFTVTFSEDVQNFNDASDVVIAHTGTANTGLTITGGPAIYNVSVTGITGEGSFTLDVDTGSDVQDLNSIALASSVTSAAVAIEIALPAASWWALLATMVSLLMAAAIVWRWRRASASTK